MSAQTQGRITIHPFLTRLVQAQTALVGSSAALAKLIDDVGAEIIALNDVVTRMEKELQLLRGELVELRTKAKEKKG